MRDCSKGIYVLQILCIMKKISLIVFASLIMASCLQNRSQDCIDVENFDAELPFSRLSKLGNAPDILGELSSFHFMDETTFLVSSAASAQVILFDIGGNQKMSIGQKGRGQFEYLSPLLVRSFDQQIFIWCSSLLKMMVFSREGMPLNEYVFTRSIKDFVVVDNTVFFYTSGGFKDESIVSVYDLSKEQYISQDNGEKTNEHEILNATPCSGGLLLHDGAVYFTPADRTIVYKIDTDDYFVEENVIESVAFQTKPVETPYEEFLRDVVHSLEYLFGSDMLTGIHKLGDHFLLMAETGNIEIQGMEIVDASDRRNTLFFLDREMVLQRIVHAPPAEGTSSCLYASYAGRLYRLQLDENLFSWALYTMDDI